MQICKTNQFRKKYTSPANKILLYTVDAEAIGKFKVKKINFEKNYKSR